MRVALAGALLAWLGACSFEDAPLVAVDANRHTPPSGSGSGNDDPLGTGGDPASSGSAGSSSGLGPDAATPPPPPDTTPGSDDAGDGSAPPLVIDGGGDPPNDAPDAGGDMSDADVPDSGGGEPDTGTSGCGEIPACVCGHDRLETPSDPCAAPDCDLSECAPDDHCRLERFGSSVYYFCSDARPQGQALLRCEEIDGMHLVYVGSQEEDAFLDDNVNGKVWIGAERGNDEVWRWLDGTPFYDEADGGNPVGDAYVNWDDGSAEPNGVGVGMGEVTCAIFWSDTGAWADTNCPANNGYVCEREL